MEGTCKNVEENGEIIGYKMKTHNVYYRGLPLSMINFVTVETDNEKVSPIDIRFTADNIDWFTLDEMETVALIKWEYGIPATVRVLKKGGLSQGEHEVSLTVSARTAYIPFPLEGTMKRKVVIE